MAVKQTIAAGGFPAAPSGRGDHSIAEVWREVRLRLRGEYGEALYSAEIARLRVREDGPGAVAILAPSAFSRAWAEDHIGARMRALWTAADPEQRRVRIAAEGAVRTMPESVSLMADAPAQARRSGERFTFDTFMVGASNELAAAAARAVAGAAPSPFNLVCFYGDYGVGKTHLLNAIAHAVELGDRRKALYLTAEEFLSGFVTAMRNGDTISFKETVRRVDVLLVDDVHFIAGKTKTEDEFLHTVAALISADRQVVLAARDAPAQLGVVDERLRSLLRGGFACELRRPDLDLRRKVLDCKIAQARCHYPKLEVPEQVRDYLAARITANARELEGVLNNILGRTAMLGAPVTMEAVETVLRDLSIAGERRVTVDDIQRAVAKRYGVSVPDLVSKRRTQSVVRPRHVAMYLAKTLTTRSLPDIGRRFGGRDHSTVIHAVRKVTALIEAGDAIKDDVERLSRDIQG